MDLSFTRTPDADRDRRQYLAVWHDRLRRPWAVGGVSTVVGAVLAVGGFATGSTLIGVVGVVFVALGIAMLVVPVILLRNEASRNAGQEKLPAAAHLDDAEVLFESAASRARFTWSQVTRVTERRGFWTAYGTDGPIFVIPKECMTSAQAAEFRTFLAQRE